MRAHGLVFFGALLAACGKPAAPAGAPDGAATERPPVADGPGGDPQDTQAPADEPDEPDGRERINPFADAPRSEPPPRPPPPPGITVLRRDAIAMALSGDGTYLAAGDLAGQALLWDLAKGRFLWADPTPAGNRLGRVAFAGAAPLYVAGSFHEPDRPWRVYAADTLEKRAELGEAGWLGLDAAVDDAGHRAVTISSTRTGDAQRLELWDLDRGALLTSLPLERAARPAVAIDAAGDVVAWADELGQVAVLAWDGAGKALKPLMKDAVDVGDTEASRVQRLALSKDGATLYGANGARLIQWTVADRRRQEVALAEPDPIRGLHRVARADGVTLVAVTRPEAGGLRLFGADGKLIGALDTGCRCETHALSLDGKVAACGSADQSELRWGRLAP